MTLPHFLIQETPSNNIIIAIFLLALLIMMLYYGFRMLEMARVMRYKKPFFTHFYPIKKRLTPKQKLILKDFLFYGRLSKKEKGYFEHRVACFIEDKTFIGRDELRIDDQVKVLISATAIMLTFGFRDFYIGLIDKIFVYPKSFYSKTNDDYHKGEFNPKLKSLVLSWEDFMHGYNIGDDNLNLGIHEFAHAIHLNSLKERDVSSTIFKDSFKELTEILSNSKPMRDKLIASRYFREYAYTNQFEFLAVLIEYFFETPVEFKTQFPSIYLKVKQMLNFSYAKY
ncbi:zinc-dependent peptidase [Flavobacteriaceae bacterium S0825]|uniref:zinc-dependent peptidase n=1 Tax=Gaetbulibacter sp. S0825 TaxID=2720084 RepID=UPI0014315BB0|nr:zinc-dependent peptidase [Gaetbulibacter sp. S0825]MCK0110419.1 zinc-dependent peptidase [Flavobacteriaceae bacterium S0825]NIX66048.1 zinc-dependent peptidase [Gaetbulibacter sp. S0825]